MTPLRVGELEIELPENVLTTRVRSSSRVISCRITGPGVADARARIVGSATAAGYVAHRRRKVITLAKAHDRIVVADVVALEIYVSTYSVDRQPPALVDDEVNDERAS